MEREDRELPFLQHDLTRLWKAYTQTFAAGLYEAGGMGEEKTGQDPESHRGDGQGKVMVKCPGKTLHWQDLEGSKFTAFKWYP